MDVQIPEESVSTVRSIRARRTTRLFDRHDREVRRIGFFLMTCHCQYRAGEQSDGRSLERLHILNLPNPGAKRLTPCDVTNKIT